MNKEDYDRICNKLGALPNTSGDWMALILKCKQIEVLEEISDSLKLIALSFKGKGAHHER